MGDVNIWMIVGFLLAAYSVVANDSLELFLGPVKGSR